MSVLHRGMESESELLTLLGLQSRFGGNWGQITWNLIGLSPKRDWSSKRVNAFRLEVDANKIFGAS